MELQNKLEILPFSEDFYKIISEDIDRRYKNAYDELSIKTVWYLMYEILCYEDWYDDELFREMLSNKIIDIGNKSYKDIDNEESKEIDALLNLSRKAEYVEQLYKFFKCLVDRKLFKKNLFTEIKRKLYKRMEEEQYEVRNALSKKNFTFDEQEKLIHYYRDTNEINIKRMIIVLRLFVPASVNELLALDWEDLKYNEELKYYYLEIYKYFDRKKKEKIFYTGDDSKKCRTIPITEDTAKILNVRKNNIRRKSGFDEKKMNAKAIIGEMNNGNYYRLKYDSVNKICKEAIENIGIESLEVWLPGAQEVITDLSKTYTDVFLTNYSYHANHTCLMTMSDINYCMGRTQYDTYAKYYVDFYNPFIHLAILVKMDRWSKRFFSSTGMEYKNVYSLRFGTHVEENEDIRFRIKSKHGVDIRIKKENGND